MSRNMLYHLKNDPKYDIDKDDYTMPKEKDSLTMSDIMATKVKETMPNLLKGKGKPLYPSKQKTTDNVLAKEKAPEKQPVYVIDNTPMDSHIVGNKVIDNKTGNVLSTLRTVQETSIDNARKRIAYCESKMEYYKKQKEDAYKRLGKLLY